MSYNPDPHLTDDQGVTPERVGGDDTGDGLLDPGERWIYERARRRGPKLEIARLPEMDDSSFPLHHALGSTRRSYAPVNATPCAFPDCMFGRFDAMSVDPLLAGRVYPPQPYEVGREKIREFAEAIGDDSAAYRDPIAARELGHDDLVAPPTFAMIPVLRGFDVLLADLGINYAQVIHADQRFEHNRPIRAGDRLSTITTLESVRSRAGNDFLGVRCEVATEDGDPVCTALATLFVRAGTAND